MPAPSPEEIAAARAAVNRKPADAVIVPAPYDDLIDDTGLRLAKGTPVWRYRSGRQYGGPSEMALFATLPGGKPFEYSYRNVESAKRMGWTE